MRELTDFLIINQWPNAKVRFALDRIEQVINTCNWGPDTLYFGKFEFLKKLTPF